MARAGRKRKINVIRDESGKSRGEIFNPSAIYAQPHRRDLKHPDATEAGYPLGRLRLNRLIDASQLRAGNEYAAVVYAYARTMGIPLGSPRSSSMNECISSGFYAWEGDRINIDQEEAYKRIRKVKDRYDACHKTLAELSKMHGRGNKIFSALREVCIQEAEEKGLWSDPDKIGDLRLGLNAIHKTLFDQRRI
jgi:hypothetical protein